MTTKVEPTVEKLRKNIEKLGNDVMRGNRIECKCPTCGDRAYGYDTEIKAKDSWIFVELSSLYERLLSHITEPTHSLISKIPSAYGVGSANLSEWDNWERKFDKKFDYRPYREGDSWYTILDKKDYNPASLEQIKDFIRHSLQEAKALQHSKSFTVGYNQGRESGIVDEKKWVDKKVQEAKAEEAQRWINQPANQHDEEIRKAERERIFNGELLNLANKVEEAIKVVTGHNQIFAEQNRKDLAFRIKVLLAYIKGASLKQEEEK